MHIRVTKPLYPGLVVGLLVLLTACQIGPLEIGLSRWNAQQGQDNAELALTVTAALATNTQIAILRTGTAVASMAAAIPATMPPSLPTQPPPPLTQGDVRLVYGGGILTLYNNTNHAINISGLSFHSDAGEMDMTRWDNGYLSASLYAFPPDDCLMAWSLDTVQQGKPDDCRTRHSWVGVNDLQTFWMTGGTFDVRWYGQNLTTCAGSNGVCYITLP